MVGLRTPRAWLVALFGVVLFQSTLAFFTSTPCGLSTCHPLATCTNSSASICSCNIGLEGDGVATCTPTPCLSLQSCAKCLDSPSCEWCGTDGASMCLPADVARTTCKAPTDQLAKTKAECDAPRKPQCSDIQANTCSACSANAVGLECRVCLTDDGARRCVSETSSRGELPGLRRCLPSNTTAARFDLTPTEACAVLDTDATGLCTTNEDCPGPDHLCVLGQCGCAVGVDNYVYRTQASTQSLGQCEPRLPATAALCGTTRCLPGIACVDGECVCPPFSSKTDPSDQTGATCMWVRSRDEPSSTISGREIDPIRTQAWNISVFSASGYTLSSIDVSRMDSTDTVTVYDDKWNVVLSMIGQTALPSTSTVSVPSSPSLHVVSTTRRRVARNLAYADDVNTFSLTYTATTASVPSTCEIVKVNVTSAGVRATAPVSSGCAWVLITPVSNATETTVDVSLPTDCTRQDTIAAWRLPSGSVTDRVSWTRLGYAETGKCSLVIVGHFSEDEPLLIEVTSAASTSDVTILAHTLPVPRVAAPKAPGSICTTGETFDISLMRTVDNVTLSALCGEPYCVERTYVMPSTPAAALYSGAKVTVSYTAEGRTVQIYTLQGELAHSLSHPGQVQVSGNAFTLVQQGTLETDCPQFTSPAFGLLIEPVRDSSTPCPLTVYRDGTDELWSDTFQGTIDTSENNSTLPCRTWVLRAPAEAPGIQFDIFEAILPDSAVLFYTGEDTSTAPAVTLSNVDLSLEADNLTQIENATVREYQVLSPQSVRDPITVPGNVVTVVYTRGDRPSSVRMGYVGTAPTPIPRPDAGSRGECVIETRSGFSGVISVGHREYFADICQRWVIETGSSSSHVRINVEALDVDQKDTIRIQQDASDGPMIAQLSGTLDNVTTTSYLSQDIEKVVVTFITDDHYETTGFRLRYEIITGPSPKGNGRACPNREHLTTSASVIRVEDYDGGECLEWLITVPSHYSRINFRVASMDIADDRLLIWSGPDPIPYNTELRVPDPLVPIAATLNDTISWTEQHYESVAGSQLTVSFHSDKSHHLSGAGFILVFWGSDSLPVDPDIDFPEVYLERNSGSFQPLTEPYMYQFSTVYRVPQLAEGEKFLFSFQEWEVGTEYDSLTLETVDREVLANFTVTGTAGSTSPLKNYEYSTPSEHRELLFRWSTSRKGVGMPGVGFVIDYEIAQEALDPAYVGKVCALATDPSVPIVTQSPQERALKRTQESGTFKMASPYPKSACWELLIEPEAVSPGVWSVSVSDVDIESVHDSLTIFDGPTQSSPVLAEVSGQDSVSSLTASESAVLAVFRSDKSDERTGFTLSWGPTTSLEINKDILPSTASGVEDTPLPLSDIALRGAGLAVLVLEIKTGSLRTNAQSTNQGTLILSGTVAEINSQLSYLSFHPYKDYCTEEAGPGRVSLELLSGVSGNLIETADGPTISVACVNDKPVLSSGTSTDRTGTEDLPLSLTPLTLTDVDAIAHGVNPAHGSATCAQPERSCPFLPWTQDWASTVELSVQASSGTVAVLASHGINGPVLQPFLSAKLDGNILDVHSALCTLEYYPEKNSCNQDDVTVSLSISDGGHYEALAEVETDSKQVAVSASCVDDQPRLHILHNVISTTEDTSVTVPAIRILDNDGPPSESVTMVKLSVEHGVLYPVSASPAHVKKTIVLNEAYDTLVGLLASGTQWRYQPPHNFCRVGEGHDTLLVELASRQDSSVIVESRTYSAIQVECVNDNPVLSALDGMTLREDAPWTVSALAQANVTDVDSTDVQVVVSLDHGTFAIETTTVKAFPYTTRIDGNGKVLTVVGPAESLREAFARTRVKPDLHFSGDATLAVTISDLEQNSGVYQTTSTITVLPIPDEPVASVTTPDESKEDETFTLTASATSPDPSEVVKLYVSPNAAIQSIVGATFDEATGWSIPASSTTHAIVPADNFCGTLSVNLLAESVESDGSVAAANTTRDVRITCVANPPQLTASSLPRTAIEDRGVSLNINAQLVEPTKEALAIVIKNIPRGATLTPSVNGDRPGTVIVNPADVESLVYTPPPHSDEPVTLKVVATATCTVCGSHAASSELSLPIETSAEADAPQLSLSSTTTVGRENIAARLPQATVVLVDQDGSETVIYKIRVTRESQPSGHCNCVLSSTASGDIAMSSSGEAEVTAKVFLSELSLASSSEDTFVIRFEVSATETQNGDSAASHASATVTIGPVAEPAIIHLPDRLDLNLYDDYQTDDSDDHSSYPNKYYRDQHAFEKAHEGHFVMTYTHDDKDDHVDIVDTLDLGKALHHGHHHKNKHSDPDFCLGAPDLKKCTQSHDFAFEVHTCHGGCAHTHGDSDDHDDHKDGHHHSQTYHCKAKGGGKRPKAANDECFYLSTPLPISIELLPGGGETLVATVNITGVPSCYFLSVGDYHAHEQTWVVPVSSLETLSLKLLDNFERFGFVLTVTAVVHQGPEVAVTHKRVTVYQNMLDMYDRAKLAIVQEHVTFGVGQDRVGLEITPTSQNVWTEGSDIEVLFPDLGSEFVIRCGFDVAGTPCGSATPSGLKLSAADLTRNLTIGLAHAGVTHHGNPRWLTVRVKHQGKERTHHIHVLVEKDTERQVLAPSPYHVDLLHGDCEHTETECFCRHFDDDDDHDDHHGHRGHYHHYKNDHNDYHSHSHKYLSQKCSYAKEINLGIPKDVVEGRTDVPVHIHGLPPCAFLSRAVRDGAVWRTMTSQLSETYMSLLTTTPPLILTYVIGEPAVRIDTQFILPDNDPHKVFTQATHHVEVPGAEDTDVSLSSAIVDTLGELVSDTAVFVDAVLYGAPIGSQVHLYNDTVNSEQPLELQNDAGSFFLASGEAIEAGLSIVPPPNSDEDIQLYVRAYFADEINHKGWHHIHGYNHPGGKNKWWKRKKGSSHTEHFFVYLSVAVRVKSAPDTITLVAPAVSGNEDTDIPLKLHLDLHDKDGSENIAPLEIRGVPTGAIIAPGQHDNGVWAVDAKDISSLVFTPAPHFSGELTLVVEAHSAEARPGLGIQVVTADQVIVVLPIVDAPHLSVPDSLSVNEDTVVNLGIEAFLNDTDGSEVLAVNITNVPVGSQMNGAIQLSPTVWSAHVANLDQVSWRAPVHVSGQMELQVSASSHELVTKDTLIVVARLPVEVLPVVDPLKDSSLVLESSSEDGTPDLHLSASLLDRDLSEELDITITETSPITGIESIPGAKPGVEPATWTFHDSGTNFNRTIPVNLFQDFSGPITVVAKLTVREIADREQVHVSSLTVTQVIQPVVDDLEYLRVEAYSPSSGSLVEDRAVPLFIEVGLGDKDGSENVDAIYISNLPPGSSMSAGVQSGSPNVTYTLALSQVSNLLYIPPRDFAGTVVAEVTITYSDGDSRDSVQRYLPISVLAEPDRPSLSTPSDILVMDEDTPVPLGISASSTDADQSERVTVQLSGIPSGASLSHGHSLGKGFWQVDDESAIDSLQFVPPLHTSNDVYSIGVTVLTTEATRPDRDPESRSSVIHIAPQAVADPAHLSPATLVGGSVTETGSKEYRLSLGVDLQDLDEDVRILLSGIPEDASLNVGQRICDGRRGVYHLGTSMSGQVPVLTFSDQETADTVDLEVSVRTADSRWDDQASLAYARKTITVDRRLTSPFRKVAGLRASVEEGDAALITDMFSWEMASSESMLGVTWSIKSRVPLRLFRGGKVKQSGKAITFTYAQGDDASLSLGLEETGKGAGIPIHLTLSHPSSIMAGATSLLTIAPVSQGAIITANTEITAQEDDQIPLNINVDVIDKSEDLLVFIRGVPSGASLSKGIFGTAETGVVLREHELKNLKLRLPRHSDKAIHLTVVAQTTEPLSGHQVTAEQIIDISITAVADCPTLTVPLALDGAEDSPFSLGISGTLTDLDGSESLQVDVYGKPGSKLVDISQNPVVTIPGYDAALALDGLIRIGSIPASQLSHAAIQGPLHSDIPFDIIVQGTATEASNQDTCTVKSSRIPVSLSGVADPVHVSVGPVSVDEDTFGDIPLVINFVDVDNSEYATVRFKNLPAGSVISRDISGEQALTPDSQGTISVLYRSIRDSPLYYRGPLHVSGALSMEVSVEVREREGGSMTSLGPYTVPIAINAIADAPVVTIESEYTGPEDEDISFGFSVSLVDTDSSEYLSDVTITIDPRFTISPAVTLTSGMWLVRLADLPDLKATPPSHFSGQVEAMATLRALEHENGHSAGVTVRFTVVVNPVADGPVFEPCVASVDMDEDGEVHLISTPSLVDTDGSESLVMLVTNDQQQAGQLFDHGTRIPFGSELDVKADSPRSISYRPPLNYHGPIVFTITATSTERDSDSQATSTCVTVLNINPVNDRPTAADTHVGSPRGVPVLVQLPVSDVDTGDSLQFTLKTLPLPTGRHYRHRRHYHHYHEDVIVFQAVPKGVEGEYNLGERIRSAPARVDDPAGHIFVVPMHKHKYDYQNNYQVRKDKEGYQESIGLDHIDYFATDKSGSVSNTAVLNITTYAHITPSVSEHCDTQVPDVNGQCGCLGNYSPSRGSTQSVRCCSSTDEIAVTKRGAVLEMVHDFKPCLESRFFRWEAHQLTSAYHTNVAEGANELLVYSENDPLEPIVISYDSRAFDVGTTVSATSPNKTTVDDAIARSLAHPQSVVISVTATHQPHSPHFVTFCIPYSLVNDGVDPGDLCLGYIGSDGVWRCEDTEIVNAMCEVTKKGSKKYYKGVKSRTYHFTDFALLNTRHIRYEPSIASQDVTTAVVGTEGGTTPYYSKSNNWLWALVLGGVAVIIGLLFICYGIRLKLQSDDTTDSSPLNKLKASRKVLPLPAESPPSAADEMAALSATLHPFSARPLALPQLTPPTLPPLNTRRRLNLASLKSRVPLKPPPLHRARVQVKPVEGSEEPTVQ